jgi:hypothetical protein
MLTAEAIIAEFPKKKAAWGSAQHSKAGNRGGIDSFAGRR